MPDTSRSIQTFGLQYDRIFQEFKDELVAEYAMMRGCYMGEYQENYDMNTNRKDNRITEMENVIHSQCEKIEELEAVKLMKKKMMGH